MGKKFGVMMTEAGKFNYRWHDAYDAQGQSTYPQAMISDLRCVRLVMRGDDNKDYPLTGVDVRLPTDQEAQAYAVMKQLLGRDTLPKKIDDINRIKARPQTMKRRDKSKPAAQFENDFSLAVISQPKGEPLRLTIEPELRSLLTRIIKAGGNIPRTALRKEKTDTFQPEKLLRSQTAKALMKAGLLGKQKKGRTTVFWAKSAAD